MRINSTPCQSFRDSLPRLHRIKVRDSPTCYQIRPYIGRVLVKVVDFLCPSITSNVTVPCYQTRPCIGRVLVTCVTSMQQDALLPNPTKRWQCSGQLLFQSFSVGFQRIFLVQNSPNTWQDSGFYLLLDGFRNPKPTFR